MPKNFRVTKPEKLSQKNDEYRLFATDTSRLRHFTPRLRASMGCLSALTNRKKWEFSAKYDKTFTLQNLTCGLAGHTFVEKPWKTC